MSLSRFDDIASFFDEVSETPLHRRMRLAPVRALGEIDGRRVLDLGTGPGGLAVDLAERGARVIGVDGAPDMLRRAAARRRRRQAGAGRALSLRLLRADAARLPLAAGSLDAVVGMLVLHLLADPVPALRECRRVAKPGARLAFLTQSDDFGPDAASRLREPIDEVETAFLEGCCRSAESHARLDREGWRRAFDGAGLPAPTITRALPGVLWLLFARLPGGADDDAES